VPENPSKVGWISLAAAGVLLLAILLAGLRARHPRVPPAAGAEAQSYFAQIAVSGAQMSAAENFLGDTITYLDARVTNHGARTVRNLRLQLEFTDTMGQVVLRDQASPVNARTLPLKSGETRAWRVSFDHMPEDWNQAPPRITVIYVAF
jgi:hypothetical protein